MDVSSTSALAQAEAAVGAVQRDPRQALELADAVLRIQGAGHDARATAHRAAGLALRQVDDIAGALERSRRAVRIADAGASPRTRAWTRLSQAFVLSAAGRDEQALAQIAAALPHLNGLDLGRARMQRGAVAHHLGRYDEARRDYAAALEVARRHDDVLGQARALNNLGIVQAHLGSVRRAHSDLTEAVDAFERLGLDVAAADARWNLAYVQAKSGDLAVALAAFAAVDDEHRRLGVPRPALVLDRLEVLLSIPLVDEARALATEAVDELARQGLPDEAEALLGQARAALLDGDLAGADAASRRASVLFRQQGRPRWTVLAQQVRLRVRYLSGERSARLADDSEGVAVELEEMGWRALALHSRLDGARSWLALGEPMLAGDQLRSASRARRGGTATTRVLGWYAEALLRRLEGEPTAAMHALRRGLTELDVYRSMLSATAMRVGSGIHGVALAREGLDLAMADARPAQVLAWSERCRAGALRVTPARAPDDDRTAAALTELRLVSAELEHAILGGASTSDLARRRTALEGVVRSKATLVGAGVQSSVVRVPSVAAVSDCLGRTALVEVFTHKGRLHAVVVSRGRATLHRLGAEADVAECARRLAFALRRCAAWDGSAASQQAALEAVRRLAPLLDDALLSPLRRRIGDADLVLVPTATLHVVPWSLLPTLRGRPLTVSPSCALYLRATAASPRSDAAGVVLAAGPGLPGGRSEVERIAARLPGACVLTDGQATVEAVMGAMDGARLVHVAAHGRFRADNALFSSLELADGPLTVYDLERLSATPEAIVLSACSSGLSAVRPGDELMGLSASLLAMGTRVLLASGAAVDDASAASLMVAVHEGMAIGLAPAAALARAQAPMLAGDPVSVAAAAAFACLGAGFDRVSTPPHESVR